MEYENPKLPEGINVTPHHPLKDAAVLVGGVLGIVALVLALLAYGAGLVARLIPFEHELRLATSYEARLSEATKSAGAVGAEQRATARAYVQRLADRLAEAQGLRPPMRIRAHFVDDDVVNAMATVGGHVIVFRGLIEVMPHENALALVLGHEVAHIKHRDPLVALGRSVVFALGLSALGVGSGQGAASEALGHAGLLTQLSFSREQERDADREALAAVAKVYGHVRGADTAFEQLMVAARGADELVPETFSSHPETRARIEALRELAKRRGFATAGQLTAIPNAIMEPLQ